MTLLSRETEAMAARLAAANRISVDEAVRQALEVWARAESFPGQARDAQGLSPADVAERNASIDRIVAEIAALPVLDPRSPEDIMDDLAPL
jgi:hypothetical protein